MKKIALILAVSLLAISMFAQTSQNRNCDNYSGIKVSGAIKVILTESAENTVKVVAPDEYQPKVITEVKDNILKIYTKDGNFNTEIIVYVTAKALNSIKATGAVKVEGTNTLNSNKLLVESTGASEVELELKTGDLTANLSGASSLKLKGTAKQLTAEISGASNMKAYKLAAGTVVVIATGASLAKVNASEKVKIVASGASVVNYTGTASDKNVETSGASTINHNESNNE